MLKLSEHPQYFNETVNLIEKSFGYQKKNSFIIDFSPLMDQSNWHQCYILLNDQRTEIIAHIALKKRSLSLKKENYPVALIGGICVAKKHRGKGLFKQLFNYIMKTHHDKYMAFLLWSDQEKIYSKYLFFQVGGQYQTGDSSQYTPSISGFELTRWSSLTQDELFQIKNLYSLFTESLISIHRTEEDWKLLQKVTSTSLYIKKSDHKIISYFFLGKGQDLKNIIHELIYEDKFKEEIINSLKTFMLWLPEGTTTPDNNSKLFYTALFKISDQKIFSHFIKKWSSGEVLIKNIDSENIIFFFNKQEYSISLKDFLQYVFGPSPLTEFQPFFKSFLIPGLDSI